MEGIAAVLRLARGVTELLAQAEEFNLMVKYINNKGSHHYLLGV